MHQEKSTPKSSVTKENPFDLSYGLFASNATKSTKRAALSLPHSPKTPMKLMFNLAESIKSPVTTIIRHSSSQPSINVDSTEDLSEEKVQNDVCYPQKPLNQKQTIDFTELGKFSKIDQEVDQNSRGFYRPAINNLGSSHRPLVPQAMVHHEVLKKSPRVDYEKDGVIHKVTETGQYGTENSNSTYDEFFEDAKDHLTETQSMNEINNFTERRNSFTMDRFAFFATEMDDTLHAPDMSSLVGEHSSFQNLFDAKNGTWWLDCLDPSDAEIRTLSRAFGVHPLTSDDVRTRDTREKVELFQNYYFVCFHTFELDPDSDSFLEPIPTYLIVFKHGILTFHFTPIPHAASVRRRIRQLKNYVAVSPDWICYALLDDITDAFVPVIRQVEIEADVIEDSVFIAREADFGPMIRKIGDARQKVMILLRLLSGKADVIKMFVKRCSAQHENGPRSEISLYLGDIQDHLVTMHQSLSVYEKIFSRSHANYLAQLQVESVNSNNRVTKVLGRVTLIGTILVPLNLVTGLFGMNVSVPGQGSEDLKWFFGIIGFIVAIVIIFSLIANRWLIEAEAEEAPPSGPKSRAARWARTREALKKAGNRMIRSDSG